jgi:molecular chaperone GrpE (heat shock protein)
MDLTNEISKLELELGNKEEALRKVDQEFEDVQRRLDQVKVAIYCGGGLVVKLEVET